MRLAQPSWPGLGSLVVGLSACSTEGLVDSSLGFEGSCTVGGSILSGIEPRLTDFHHLLLNPPKVWRASPFLFLVGGPNSLTFSFCNVCPSPTSVMGISWELQTVF